MPKNQIPPSQAEWNKIVDPPLNPPARRATANRKVEGGRQRLPSDRSNRRRSK